MINVVAKGKEGERQVAKALNERVAVVLTKQQWPHEIVAGATKCIQRNQNQSAVGGCDLSNVFGLAVEVKRQQQLSINSWWRQCVDQAQRNNEIPVLCYRQNNQPWRVVMYLQAPYPVLNEVLTAETVYGRYGSKGVRAEISWDDFLDWFEVWVHRRLLNGDVPRV